MRNRLFVMCCVLCAVVVLGVGVSSALACGAFFPTKEGTNAAMDAQRIFYRVTDTQVEATVQVRANTEAKAFVWVLPIPAEVKVELGNPNLFNILDPMTQPRVSLVSESTTSGPVLGCSGSASNGASKGRNAPAVQRFDGGVVGDYKYDVLKAEKAADMVKWLQDNGYRVEASASASLQPYLDMGLRFLWVKFNANIAPKVLQPLKITMPAAKDGKLMYPLALSKTSIKEGRLPVLIYVMAEQRYAASSLENVITKDVAKKMAELYSQEPNLATYENAVNALSKDSKGLLMVTEFAKSMEKLCAGKNCMELDGKRFFVTRLFASIAAEQLIDIMLVPNPKQEAVAHEVTLTVSGTLGSVGTRPPTSPSLPVSLLLVMLVLLWHAKRLPVLQRT